MSSDLHNISMEEIELFDSSSAEEDNEDPVLRKRPSIGVEQVDNEEFDFLDGVSELAILRSGRSFERVC